MRQIGGGLERERRRSRGVRNDGELLYPRKRRARGRESSSLLLPPPPSPSPSPSPSPPPQPPMMVVMEVNVGCCPGLLTLLGPLLLSWWPSCRLKLLIPFGFHLVFFFLECTLISGSFSLTLCSNFSSFFLFFWYNLSR